MAVKTNYNKQGYQYYRVRKSILDENDGKPIQKEFYGKNKTEAENKRDAYMEGIQDGLNNDYQKARLGDLLKTWLFEVVKNRAAESTFERYECIYRNYVKNTKLNNLLVYKIKPMTLQRHYNQIFKEGINSNKIFSLNKLLKTFFNYMIAERYLTLNPCFKAVIPKKEINDHDIDSFEDEEENSNVDPFSDEEIEQFKPHLKGNMVLIVLIALGTGLRRGEVTGLSPKLIKLDKNEILVARSLKRIKIYNDDDTHLHINAIRKPKTKKSYRSVPIPPALVEPIKLFIEEQKNKYESNGLKYNENSLLFSTKFCNMIDGKTVLVSWKRVLRRSGVRYRKFHNLRHTYATKLFEAGVDILTVSRLLGHKSISITEKIYIHVLPKVKNDAVEKINYLFEN